MEILKIPRGFLLSCRGENSWSRAEIFRVGQSSNASEKVKHSHSQLRAIVLLDKTRTAKRGSVAKIDSGLRHDFVGMLIQCLGNLAQLIMSNR
jgi:hypothetical protein